MATAVPHKISAAASDQGPSGKTIHSKWWIGPQAAEQLKKAAAKEPLRILLSRAIGQAAFCRANLACLRRLLRYLSGLIAALILGVTVRVIWAQHRPTSDLSEAGLEDLMNIKVTS